MIVKALHCSPLLILLAVCAAVPSFNAAAAEEPTYKFEFFSMEGARYRFNKESGDVEKLVINSSGCAWIKQDVQKSSQQPTDNKVAEASKRNDGAHASSSSAPSTGSSAIILPTPAGNRDPLDPEIRILDDKDQDITEILTDEQRKSAAPAITNYENKLSIAQTFNIGDHITGTILVRNSGEKRLRALELTMSIPVNGKAKPEEKHFLFVDKSGQTPPPQPGLAGKEGMPLLQKVDIPAPAGDVKGSPELRITYLQFAD